MNSTELLLNSRTGLLRSGWRAAIFLALLYSPYLILNLFVKGEGIGVGAGVDVSLEMILTYMLTVAWVVTVSWICLRFMEKMKLSALGFALHSGWFSDVLKGCVIGALMIASVVMLQVIGGGSRLSLNPVWLGEQGINWTGVRIVAAEAGAALVLFILGGAFEELVFRGYAFQTLLRGAPAFVPILLFSIYFGWAHWDNPDRTLFSTANTALAGIWLSIAYLRTRSLWFPTALHFIWNWVMGAFFGIPVSGLRIPQHPILLSSSGEPVWLTGGSYGSEGGVAATAVLIIAIFVIWRARWLSVSPEMNLALSERAPDGEFAINLGLRNGSD
ncbi:MAG TPA: CPBP family intramembrane glutamic endopeptidase [Blastocatellia bacterium]|nr:CPBP family intramembrane glutamic endopeptidase [Blastocatellia bacterium]